MPEIPEVIFPELTANRTADAGRLYMKVLREAHNNGQELEHRLTEAAAWVKARTGLTWVECCAAYGADPMTLHTI